MITAADSEFHDRDAAIADWAETIVLIFAVPEANIMATPTCWRGRTSGSRRPRSSSSRASSPTPTRSTSSTRGCTSRARSRSSTCSSRATTSACRRWTRRATSASAASGLEVDPARIDYYVVLNLYWAAVCTVGSGARAAAEKMTHLDVLQNFVCGLGVAFMDEINDLIGQE